MHDNYVIKNGSSFEQEFLFDKNICWKSIEFRIYMLHNGADVINKFSFKSYVRLCFDKNKILFERKSHKNELSQFI